MTTQKLNLPIVIGKKYLRRDGVVTTITGNSGAFLGTYYTDAPYSSQSATKAYVYIDTGRALPGGDGSPDGADLIADHIEPATEARKEHHYAQVLRWIADGEQVQFKACTGQWADEVTARTLTRVVNGLSDQEYRLKPSTITVNGRDIPEPMTETPGHDNFYWVPVIHSELLADQCIWRDGTFDYRALSRGIAHSTEAGAIAHAKAWLGIE